VLLSRLGLRVGEVAALTLDDIDWRHGEIVIRGKGGCRERLPLPADAGQALAGYLSCGRPALAGRFLFLRVLAPRDGLSPTGIATVVRAAFSRLACGARPAASLASRERPRPSARGVSAALAR
jgi:integrase/recombinase XerD